MKYPFKFTIKGEEQYIVEIPTKFIVEYFKVKNEDFLVDVFEELILRDILQNDLETTKKLKRNVTPMLKEWFKKKIQAKENISVNIKGTTRSGKSVGGLVLVDNVLENYEGKEFDTETIVCGNQKEFRTSLPDSEFGDMRQIDENAFANVGLGSMTEVQQLKDIQNIIAKKNVGTIYITPRMFLETGATIGLSTWGKDVKNWLSRYLVYDLRSSSRPLLGYVVVDIGKLFRKYGCYLYKDFGGCTNPNLVSITKRTKKELICLSKKDKFNHKVLTLNSELIDNSTCIPAEFRKEPLKAVEKLLEQDIKQRPCPFYRVCKHPMNKYELKKDTWIDKEMKGGLDERTQERYSTAIKLLAVLGVFNPDNGQIMLKARDGKQLKLKININLGDVSSTKFTGTELDDILVALKSMTDFSFLKDLIKKCGLVKDEIFKTIMVQDSDKNLFEFMAEMEGGKINEEKLKNKKPIKKEI